MGVTIDATSFIKGTKNALTAIEKAGLQGINDVASEILRLGTFEVPHDKGILQGTGHVEPESNERVVVGYNTVYAARLHEHPEYRFQKGRKGKYLEDPIKNNLSVFRNFIASAVQSAFR